MYKILVLNLGSTSTKVAYYQNDICIKNEIIDHPANEINQFSDIFDQAAYRENFVKRFLVENEIDKESLDVIVSRGGHTKSVEGGVYQVNEEMLKQQASGLYGNHPCDLGSKIAFEISKSSKAIPLIVDPPVTDEFEPLARLSGHPLIERRSSFHALSHKATAKKYAHENGFKYDELNLIVVHLGGGISVAPHRKGRMIDGENGLEGDGPYSTNRTGALPVGDLVKLCFGGKYSYDEIHKMLNGKGGLMAYLGQSDVRIIEKNAKTDEKSALYLDGMIYQVCKQIGACAAVLCGNVDAVLITGGIAHSKSIIQKIEDRCSFIAPIIVYPGENEMKSLLTGALSALKGEEKIKKFKKI